MKKIFLLMACMPFFLTTSCNNDDDAVVCTQEAKAGLNVTVKDAVTNAVLSDGVTVIAQDGPYVETLQLFTGDDVVVFFGAIERVGTYIVTVSKEGYQTFTSEPIVVTADVCHVIPQLITVNLQPN
ncbi:MAG: carboxypeptidase-like regulatory domain-containing protein [Flavobacterium sp.]|nr:carboxypeptidase-like regulatory domain-containing protein [Flavobacterium sp.]